MLYRLRDKKVYPSFKNGFEAVAKRVEDGNIERAGLTSKTIKIPESRITKIPDLLIKKLFSFASFSFNILCPKAWPVNVNYSGIVLG